MIKDSLGITVSCLDMAVSTLQINQNGSQCTKRSIILLEIVGAMSGFRPVIALYETSKDSLQESIPQISNKNQEHLRYFLIIVGETHENHVVWPLFSIQDYNRRVLSNFDISSRDRCLNSHSGPERGERVASPPPERKFEPLIYYWPEDKDNIWGPPRSKPQPIQVQPQVILQP